nr:retrovirus-related Pol polyprotein from transposon TNT 1-94 [Tanacetum cinerariifolium]
QTLGVNVIAFNGFYWKCGALPNKCDGFEELMPVHLLDFNSSELGKKCGGFGFRGKCGALCYKCESISTACYVQNRVLVVKPRNKTPYELFHGRTLTLSFMRPFGCPITILNTIDHLGKFNGKADEGFFVGYSLNSKAFRVFNSKTRIMEENLHISDDEKKVNEDLKKDSKCKDQEKKDNVNNTNNVNTAGNVNTVSSTVNVAGINAVNAVGGK